MLQLLKFAPPYRKWKSTTIAKNDAGVIKLWQNFPK